MTMKKRRVFLARRFVDFMWGDRTPVVICVRLAIKLIITILVATGLHEGFTWGFLSLGPSQGTELLTSFAKANAILKDITPPTDAGYASVSICLDAKPKIKDGCPSSQFDPSNPIGRDRDENRPVTYAVGYQLLANYKDKPPEPVATGTIYHVISHVRLISSAHISESIDTLLRKVELVTFNGTKKPITDVKLCNGTRSVELSANCNKTKQIGEALGTPGSGIITAATAPTNAVTLQSLIDRVRFNSLFVGLIQFGTLCVFLYAVLETLGLWLRWVAPGDRLFEIVTNRRHVTTSSESESNVTAPGTTSTAQAGATTHSLLVPTPLPTALDEVLASTTRSLGDRLYLVDLKAAAEAPGSPPATQEEFVSVHSSYRDYLQEDAVARQDFLETLGDTMLKLAFLGTVYGISAALFGARGLDTADPILRLATKADMYSGIGIGFGATLLGILLSIIAAQMRTVLAAAWSGKIGIAYQLILDFGIDGLREQAKKLEARDVLRIHPYVPLPNDPKLTSMERFGLFVLIVAVLAGVVAGREQLYALFHSIFGP